MTKPPHKLLEFLRRYEPGVQAVTLGLRTVVLEELAPCHEYIFEMPNKVVLLYGPTDRVIEDCVCMISAHRKHANLTFTHGVELGDPSGLLQGSGARMRHVSVKSLSELERPEIRACLLQARKTEIGWPRRRNAAAVITAVKTTSARKRVRRS